MLEMKSKCKKIEIRCICSSPVIYFKDYLDYVFTYTFFTNVIKPYIESVAVYSRTSVARTLMARLPTAVSNSFLSPLEKNLLTADLG